MADKRSSLNRRLDDMITGLKNWQRELLDHGYLDSSRLLGIAALDLQMRLHKISDLELKAFCNAVRQHTAKATPDRPLHALGRYCDGAQNLPATENIILMREVTERRKKADRG